MTNDNFVPPVPGQALTAPPQEVLDGIKFDDEPSVSPEPILTPATPAPVTPPLTPEVSTPEVVKEKEPTLPSRFDGEGDVQYDLRTKLFVAGQAKANAVSDEEKSILSQEMKRIRADIAQANKNTQVQQTPVPTQTPDEDERASAIRTVKDLGFKTADEINADIDRIVNERLQAANIAQVRSEQDAGIADFYKFRDDIASDENKRATLENYVLEMFKPQLPSMTKQQLLQALDMSASYLFPKGTVAKQADQAQAKIDALNIHGNQGGDASAQTVSADSRQKLRDMGWTETEIQSFEKK